jgi:hypothetical protein
MCCTLHHFQSYKTLGPITGSSLTNFTSHLTFKPLSGGLQRSKHCQEFGTNYVPLKESFHFVYISSALDRGIFTVTKTLRKEKVLNLCYEYKQV